MVCSQAMLEHSWCKGDLLQSKLFDGLNPMLPVVFSRVLEMLINCRAL